MMRGSLLIIDESNERNGMIHQRTCVNSLTSHICLKSESRLTEPHLVGCECDRFFSSPELKVQVTFSDQNLSVVCHRHCCRRCCRRCHCHKLFTFSSSSLEPWG